MSAIQSTYIQGETATVEVVDGGYSAVTLRYGAAAASMTLADGVWTATLATSALSGRYNWAIFADGKAIGSGSFYVRPLVSKWRPVVDAIDTALQKLAANGKYSVTVGDISLQDKTYDEMMKFRAHYAALAEGDEDGTGAAGGPVRTMGVYL